MALPRWVNRAIYLDPALHFTLPAMPRFGIIQLFRNKTPVAVSPYGTKIDRRIFSACRINYSFVQHSNAEFKLCRRDAHHP